MSGSKQKKKSKIEQPYPGLRYYENDTAAIFAGRDKQIKKCIPELISSSILVLHGRTGCGKSSFLRAGIKPYLKNNYADFAFDEGVLEGFEVIRSTDRPLRELAIKVLKEAKILLKYIDSKGKSEPSVFGDIAEDIFPDDLKTLKSLVNQKDLLENIVDEYPNLVNIIQLMGELLDAAPIFVIDQAEEIFTIKTEEEVQSLDVDPTDEEIVEKEFDNEIEIQEENSSYFYFLHSFARSEGAAKIVISLRTEYKGQFDNELQERAPQKPSNNIRGFYLDDLNEQGLREAILRPTLKEQVWGDGESTPYEKFGFEFEDSVVNSLIKELSSDNVPAGGILPVLQVSCLRLWQISQRVTIGSRSSKNKKVTITQDHFFQLGAIANQIELYLNETIETHCTEVAAEIEKRTKTIKAWPEEEIDETISSRWHRILNASLVKIESDGRAVTKSKKWPSFIMAAKNAIGEKANDKAVKKLAERLAQDEVGVLRIDDEGVVTLGHDSLALALSKWQARFGKRNMTMMRMMMSSSGIPAEYTTEQLFPNSEDRPHEILLYMPQDFAWDHQLPFFAQAKGFAERLGIKIVPDDKLVARKLFADKGGMPDLPALNYGIVERETGAIHPQSKMPKRGFEDLRKSRKSNDRVLVAADWNTFPGSVDYKNTKRTHAEPAIIKRQDYMWRFCDVMISDLFLGNGLVGKVDNWGSRLRELENTSKSLQYEAQKNLINDAFDYLVKNNAQIMCHNKVSLQFLEIAAKRVEHKKFLKYMKEGKGKSANVLTQSNADYQTQDRLISWLREDLSDIAEETRRPRFIVGTSHSRALALQAGYTLLFDANHVTSVVNSEIESVKANTNLDYEKRLKEISNLAKEVQQIVSHNLWQLSLPASQWDQGANRATVLRLASIGYFTTEHVRTNAAEFVLHLQEFLKNMFATQVDNGQARLTRSTIENIWQNCYSLYRFEEVSSNYYDTDSVHAYLSKHLELNSVSVAASVHSELVRLRAETLASFEMVSKTLSWLHARDLFDPSSENISNMYQYKEAAWKNFRIFNFYDAEWQMALASRYLKIEVEQKSKIDA